MDVGSERERWRVMSEPDLDLLRVQAVPEEDRDAGVAERVESSLGNTRFPRCWLEYATHEVRRVELPARLGDENERIVLLVPRCRQRYREACRRRNRPPARSCSASRWPRSSSSGIDSARRRPPARTRRQLAPELRTPGRRSGASAHLRLLSTRARTTPLVPSVPPGYRANGARRSRVAVGVSGSFARREPAPRRQALALAGCGAQAHRELGGRIRGRACADRRHAEVCA